MENNERPLGWTSLEDSWKLVKAGIDPDTADMYYLAYTTHADGKPIKKPKYGLIPKSYTERRSIGVGFTRVDYKPCWSLGLLFRIIKDARYIISPTQFLYCNLEPIEFCVMCVENLLKEGDIEKIHEEPELSKMIKKHLVMPQNVDSMSYKCDILQPFTISRFCSAVLKNEDEFGEVGVVFRRGSHPKKVMEYSDGEVRFMDGCVEKCPNIVRRVIASGAFSRMDYILYL